jgi:catechol 2,3-dioxygenase-like lactoylglutathione lyase family enzyme
MIDELSLVTQPMQLPMQLPIQLPWHHIHITIAERSEAARWYEQTGLASLGTPTKRSENLRFDGNLVQVQSESVASPSSSRFHSLGVEVADLDSAVDSLESAGATVLERRAQSALMTDPFGTCIELVPGAPGRQSHLNIVCEDPVAHADWYAAMLGGELAGCAWDDARRAVRWDGELLCFLPDGTPNPDRAIDHMGWFTPDLDETFDRLTAAGVEFPVPPRPFGAVKLAFLKDPGGIWIELVEVKPSET